MRRILAGSSILLVLLLVARPAAGQVRYGAGASFGTESSLGLGGRLQLDVGGRVAERPLHGQFSFEYFFDACDPVDCTYFEITPAAFIPFEGQRVHPFAGVGLNIAHASFDFDSPGLNGSDTNIGIALLGGVTFPMGNVTGQGEGRLSLGGSGHLVLTFAVLFGSRSSP